MKTIKKHKEIILYIVFGVLTTFVSWSTYTLFVNLFGWSVSLANVISWICSVLFAFVTNKLWVFESKEWHIKTLAKEMSTFVASRLLTGAIEIFGVPLLEKTGFDSIFTGILRNLNISYPILFTKGLYSKISFAFIIVVLNYVFSKLIVFKKKSVNNRLDNLQLTGSEEENKDSQKKD